MPCFKRTRKRISSPRAELRGFLSENSFIGTYIEWQIQQSLQPKIEEIHRSSKEKRLQDQQTSKTSWR
jgi:hypothetical protein